MLEDNSCSTKDRILRFIQKNPGCYLRQIRNELSLSMGSVQYHAYQLQRSGKITSTREGLYKLHFQSGAYKDHEKLLFRVLNQETPREIILFIDEIHTLVGAGGGDGAHTRDRKRGSHAAE